jgi:hypothetical protein
MSDGSQHTPRFDADSLPGADGVRFQDELARLVAAHGMTPDQFADLVDTPITELSRTELDTVIDVRDRLPSPSTAGVLQKTIYPDAADAIVASASGGTASAMHDVGGFVARPADTAGLTTTEINTTLGLDYTDSPFTDSLKTGRAFDDVIYDADPTHPPKDADSVANWLQQEVPDAVWSLPPADRADAVKAFWDGLSDDAKNDFEARYPSIGWDLGNALDPSNPFRGNGFSGVGRDYLPEASYGRARWELPDGAELWRTLPDGGREFVGVFQRPDPAKPGTWVTRAPVGGSAGVP